MKSSTDAHPHPGSFKFYSFVALFFLIFGLSDCRTITSKAKGKASNIGCAPDVGLINGEADAGYTASLTVTNVGQEGFINIKAELSSSEGEWKRNQDLQFKAGESRNLSFFFHEPSINATGIQCRAGISPKAD